MRYLACENQGYPDLHQVGFIIFMGKIKKNAPFEGAPVCSYTLFLNNFLDIFLLCSYFLGKSWLWGASKITVELELNDFSERGVL